MGDIVSRVKIFIDYSGGQLQLKRLKSGDEDSDEDIEVVRTIGVDGGAGFRDQTGGGSLAFDVFREINAEVDWRKLRRTKEKFKMRFEDEGGTQEQFLPCRVAKVSRKSDSDGNHMDSVKVVYANRVDL